MDREKFEEELLSLHCDLRNFAIRLTSNHHEEADDLLQDTILKILKNCDNYQEGTNFKAWAYTVMRNILINDDRRRAAHQRYIEVAKAGLSNEVAADCGCAITEADVLVSEMKRVIERLPDEYRVPFVLFSRGFKYKDISKRLELPMTTVRNRIHGARIKLRMMLDG